MSVFAVATLTRPLDGQTECGDIVASIVCHNASAVPVQWLIVIDGLGHGPAAARAARQALAVIEAEAASTAGPWTLLRRLDAALMDTRGAAVGVARLQGRRLQYAGLGNTRALRWRDGQALRLPSHYGIVGEGQWNAGRHETPPTEDIDLHPGDWVLMFTDGLDEAMHLDVMLPEWIQQPQRLCEHLMNRWSRSHDDAAVLVCRISPPD